MAKHNSISLYLTNGEEEKIEEAAKLVSQNKSTFCRTLAVKEAKKILKENSEASS